MKKLLIWCLLLYSLNISSGCINSSGPQKEPGKPDLNSTQNQGIDFKQEMFPSFVAAIKGMGEKEFFGRWSVGDTVTIVFKDPLPKNFIIQLQAAAFGPNVGKPFQMIIGDQQQEFSLSSGHPEKMEELSLPFQIKSPTNTIVVKVPDPTAPKTIADSSDERRLGIAFSLMQLKRVE